MISQTTDQEFVTQLKKVKENCVFDYKVNKICNKIRLD